MEDKVNEIMADASAAMIAEELVKKLLDEERKRHEFYNLIAEDDKAEFVNGEIIFHSFVMKGHTDATGRLYNLLATYVEEKNLGWVGIEEVLTRFSRNDYEPDLCFFKQEKAAEFREQQLIYPIPDFIVEVLSKSNKKTIEHDAVTKF